MRGKKAKANSAPELEAVIRETARLWRRAHLDYDQSKYVVERLLAAAYRLNPRKPVFGLMLKTLFYTGVRVSEFVHLRAQDAYLDGDAPHIYVHKAKKGSVRYVPILPALAQELRVHLAGRTRGCPLESSRHTRYNPGHSEAHPAGGAG